MKILVTETPPSFLDLDAPTLSAYDVNMDGVFFWRVWCMHCGTWRHHGIGSPTASSQTARITGGGTILPTLRCNRWSLTGSTVHHLNSFVSNSEVN